MTTQVSELNQIKQFQCPTCDVRPRRRCVITRDTEVKIYPYASGSSEDEWVHPARRSLAVRARAIPDSGEPTARGISIIRALIRRQPKRRNGR